jgi:hypothetical protein
VGEGDRVPVGGQQSLCGVRRHDGGAGGRVGQAADQIVHGDATTGVLGVHADPHQTGEYPPRGPLLRVGQPVKDPDRRRGDRALDAAGVAMPRSRA